MATNSVGLEAVDVVKDDDAEYAVLYRTDNPVRVELGESAGNVITSEAQYFLVVDVNVSQDEIAADLGLDTSEVGADELDEMFESMGIPTEVNEGAVALSNEQGEVGHVVLREDDADFDTILAQFEEQYL